MDEHGPRNKFAVLIDGDNAQASLLPQILTEVSTLGLITIKRIYGDWTTTEMNRWKESLHKNAIQPMQQFRNTVGKNATDSAMIIDAMDLRAFGVGPRTWLAQLHYRQHDYALIALGLVLLVGALALSLLGYGQLWVPMWALVWAM